MREGDVRCFSVDVPKDTLVVGTFSCADPTAEMTSNLGEPISTKNFGILVKVKDPLDRLIYNKNHDMDAKFALTSHVGGQHQVCFQTNTSSWFNPSTFVSSYLFSLDPLPLRFAIVLPVLTNFLGFNYIFPNGILRGRFCFAPAFSPICP